MKAAIVIVLSVAVLVLSSCSLRGHANRNSTGGGVSTPIGSLGGAIRY